MSHFFFKDHDHGHHAEAHEELAYICFKLVLMMAVLFMAASIWIAFI